MSVSELPAGVEIILAENREIEQISKLQKEAIADHVWNTCRPSPKFSSNIPTVTARRIQTTRLHLQNNPQLMEKWETEVSEVDEENAEEGEQESDDDELSPAQYSSSVKASEVSSSSSAELSPAEQKSDSDRRKVSERSFECSTDAPSGKDGSYSSKKTCEKWSGIAVPVASSKKSSTRSLQCSTGIPSGQYNSYGSNRASEKFLGSATSSRNSRKQSSAHLEATAQYSSRSCKKQISNKSSTSSTEAYEAQCSSHSSRKTAPDTSYSEEPPTQEDNSNETENGDYEQDEDENEEDEGGDEDDDDLCNKAESQ